ncbi:MAG: LuxR C-terminal-related transcriptional regulator [Woeseiaceae bacterium]|nr:LuxR C-terminal-related transcriptional regulator [Woeseiaceae bacterium]
MSSPFVSSGWFDSVASLISADAGEATADALIDAVGSVVEHEGTCLLAFHSFAPPEVLHHTLEPDAATHYLDRYLAGPYLLDPLYQLALRAEKPGVCRYRDETPDRFHSSEYYRQYCERTHLRDEIDYLVDVADATTLALVVARRERPFRKVDIDRLRQIRPVVHAAMRALWERWPGRQQSADERRSVHRRLTECFENFGDGLLTQRERETTQLLLRGFSTKAIARRLDIAPGTVMVHKRNLFAKLRITSQYELFSRFIDTLADETD